MPKIILTENQKEILSTHAEQENPNESCAILFGKETQEVSKVEKIFLTENIEQSPVNFTISAEQRLEADKIERESELKIIGIFHSHPNSEAYPSDTDKKFMEINPGVWVIFSGALKNFKAYVLDKGIKEIPIEFT
ncbi:MAG: Mov34/MPN/PAD-1 family protein [Nitrosopumilaceae archaeon]